MKALITLILIFSSVTVFSQGLTMSIDTLKVGRLSVSQTNEISHDQNGPYIKVIGTIKNTSDELLVLQPSDARYFFTFTINGRKYRKETFPLAFMDNQSLKLQPGDSVTFKASDDLLYGTDLFHPQDSDYKNDLIKILPTLKFSYVQKKLSVHSISINNVMIE